MPDTDGKLPPQIMELLKRRGWTWPPNAEMRRQFREARAKFLDKSSMDPEVRKELLKSFPGRFPDDSEGD